MALLVSARRPRSPAAVLRALAPPPHPCLSGACGATAQTCACAAQWETWRTAARAYRGHLPCPPSSARRAGLAIPEGTGALVRLHPAGTSGCLSLAEVAPLLPPAAPHSSRERGVVGGIAVGVVVPHRAPQARTPGGGTRAAARMGADSIPAPGMAAHSTVAGRGLTDREGTQGLAPAGTRTPGVGAGRIAAAAVVRTPLEADTATPGSPRACPAWVAAALTPLWWTHGGANV